MPATASKADIFFNKTNVALARSQSLVRSWLPPPEEGEPEAEVPGVYDPSNDFTFVPERLGVGAPLPKDGTDATLATSSAIPEKLRKLLLGKSASRNSGESSRTAPHTNKAHPVSKRPLNTSRVKAEEESEEEESRASIIKSKKRLPQQAVQYGNDAPATLPKKLKTDHPHTGSTLHEEQSEGTISSRNAGSTNVREQLLLEDPPGDQPDAAATPKKKRKKRRKQKRADQVTPDTSCHA